jgi:ribosomal protein S18 acetylase RimI-like enzyme
VTAVADTIVIRTAAASDDEELAELDYLSWTPESAVIPRPAADRPFFTGSHSPGSILVAEHGGRIAGYIRVVPATPLQSNAHVRQIQGLAVAPGFRGLGIGRALVASACEQAARDGARRITLHVLSSNAPARRLYAAAGFTVEGVLPGEFWIEGRYVDDIMMGRSLDAPDARTAGTPDAHRTP